MIATLNSAAPSLLQVRINTLQCTWLCYLQLHMINPDVNAILLLSIVIIVTITAVTKIVMLPSKCVMFADDYFCSECDAKYGFSSSGAAALHADVEAASQVIANV
jgi:hypothetical protein